MSDQPCGTLAAYSGGCRCEDCTTARSDYDRTLPTPSMKAKQRAHAAWKAKNPTYYADHQRQRRETAKAYLAEAKAHPCVDCGGTFPTCVMDFDHLPGAVKVYNVSQMTNLPVATIQAEIDKCELVCANCHRIRTSARLGEGAA